jgi:hypothetical protein
LYNWLTREQGGELVASQANRGAVGLRFAQLLRVHLLEVAGNDRDVGGDEVVGEAGEGRL